jgi:hypothetical protein
MNKIFRNVLMVTSIFATGLFSSCEMDDPEVEHTAVSEMSGEWFVQWDVQDPATGGWDPVAGYTHIMTSNTSANTSTEMWIGDLFGDPRNLASTTVGTFWTFMVRANVNLDGLTFTANDKSIATVGAKPATATTPAKPPVPYDINVKIMDGKIIKDGSTPPSGTTTDSIQFQIEFEDDPGTIYRASGYKRTGFLEDEH